jgi:hypothetical protein
MSPFWQGRPWQAFKNFAIIFSFTVNVILVVALLLVAPLLLPIIGQVATPLVGGLNQSFVDMGKAHIMRTITVDDTIPISFTLPLNTETAATLTEGVTMAQVPATFVLPGGGGVINGQVTLTLPPGLALPVALNLSVPVSQSVPVHLEVAVDIPLAETELGPPFAALQESFGPLHAFLAGLPGSNEQLLQRIKDSAAPVAPTTEQQASPD